MTITYLRSGWGALPPNWIIPSQRDVEAFTVHHPVSYQPASYMQSIDLAQRFQRQHLAETDENGKLVYGDLAYNAWSGWNCCGVGRGVDVGDGATTKHNVPPTWSICVWGDYRTDTLTPEARAGLIAGLRLGVAIYGRKPVRPHSYYYATDCCGSNLRDELPSIEAELYGDDAMTDAEIDKLSTAIVDKLMTAPVTVHSYDKPGTPAYPTTFAGWLDFMHGEQQQTRLKP